MRGENDVHKRSPSEVLDSLPADEARQAREEADRSVRRMLQDLGVSDLSEESNDVARMQFNWDRVRDALFEGPAEDTDPAPDPAAQPAEPQEGVSAHVLVPILDALDGGDVARAETLTSELLCSHPGIVQNAFRAVEQRLGRRNWKVCDEAGQAIQSHGTPSGSEGMGSPARLYAVVVLLASVVSGVWGTPGLRRHEGPGAVIQALDDSLKFHTSG